MAVDFVELVSLQRGREREKTFFERVANHIPAHVALITAWEELPNVVQTLGDVAIGTN